MEAIFESNSGVVVGSGRKVIFQRFERAMSRHTYPYPPVYREPDTDYICFTADEGVHSKHWRIERVEALCQEDLEPYLAGYDQRFELAQNQIQMGSVFGEKAEDNILTPPSLDDLPLVKLDLEKFEPTADENGNYLWKENPVYQKGRYKGRPLLLTIGVPVSNQIGTIDRCLSHIKPLLDRLDAELVVIDTGSTDGTIEVCRKYGARVYEHPWHDNMSAVRNEAIRHARGLWYMSIDDDEWFEDVDEILSFFQSGAYRKYHCATYIQRNYTSMQGKIFSNHHTLRMAEITPGVYFEGRIHDALTMDPGPGCCHLESYAHHYGFVGDQPERQHAKFLRNASILLQDVHEYPEDGRYLFQLANEYAVIKRHDTALGLGARCLSLSVESGDEYRAKQCVGLIIGCLYILKDERLFAWADRLDEAYHTLRAARGISAWHLCHLAAAKGRPAEEVLSYFDRYERLLREYREDTDADKKQVFLDLAKMEHDHFIMSAMALGFFFNLVAGEEGKALRLLEHFSLEGAEENRMGIMKWGFAAGGVLYEAFYGKLLPVQWEEWSGTVLDAAGAVLTWKTAGRRMTERLPGILARVSVSAVLSWIASDGMTGLPTVRAALEKYALSCVREGRIFAEETPVQELALCYGVLEKAYAERRRKGDTPGIGARQSGVGAGTEKAVQSRTESGTEETGQGTMQASEGTCTGQMGAGHQQEPDPDLLQAYLMAAGIFMERYYPPELLSDPGDTSIPPQDRAAYLMATVLADGTADSGNIALLKQALAIYPPFHQEIKDILRGLAA